MGKKLALLISAAAVGLGLFSGCTLGPRALRMSRAKYNDAVLRTGEEEMLLNLARLRYGENPEFLAVEGITTQYRFETAAQLEGTLLEAGPNLLDINGEFRRRERPTITLAPQQDEEFYSRLLAPIDLETILLLTRNGWATDRMLRMCVHNINGLDNASLAGGPTPELAPEFEEFTYLSGLIHHLKLQRSIDLTNEARLIRISDSVIREKIRGQDLVAAAESGFEFRRDQNEKKMQLVTKERQVVLRVNDASVERPEIAELRRLLQLRNDRVVYELNLANQNDVQGIGGPLIERLPDPNEERHRRGRDFSRLRTDLNVATRSILELMYYLSHAIEIPEDHLECGLARVTFDHDGEIFDWNRVTGDLLRVSVSEKRPSTAAIAAKYRGYWFYIDQRDHRSKATFSLLLQLYNLEIRGGGGENLPILAIGLGGDD